MIKEKIRKWLGIETIEREAEENINQKVADAFEAYCRSVSNRLLDLQRDILMLKVKAQGLERASLREIGAPENVSFAEPSDEELSRMKPVKKKPKARRKK